MLKLEDFKAAKERVDEVITPTPLIYSEPFSTECRNQVYIKPENLQKTGAFKIRGAYNKIRKLSEEEKAKGLIAASAGNHAQGVAYAARELGAKAVICMPAHTPLIKVENTEKLGAEVVLHGEVYDDAYNKCMELVKKNGYTLVHPFDDEDVIEGQGTIALEILEELPDTDVILVPVGGGGLISGVAAAAKSINPRIKIIGVEPEGAASALAAINEDRVVSLKEANTYLTPVTLIPVLLSVITMYMEPSSVSMAMMNIPILNVVIVIKEIIFNQLNYVHLYMTIGWSIVYVIVSMIAAKMMYEKEEVIFRA